MDIVLDVCATDTFILAIYILMDHLLQINLYGYKAYASSRTGITSLHIIFPCQLMWDLVTKGQKSTAEIIL